MPSPIVVFDLDGTLVDTAPDLVSTLNSILAREDLSPVDYERGRNMVGGGARMMIERGLKDQRRMLPAADIDRMERDFVAYYAEHIADRSRPFPGLDAALDELGRSGYRFAVCTNKLERLSIRLLKQLGLADRFAAICGADTFGTPKPDPQILRRTIARAQADPTRAVMVGDSITDIATARAAAIPVIAVDFGYTETPIAELRPDRIVSHLAAVPAAVFGLLGTAA
jgi:phosphoglycolate phosphatase